MPDAEKGDATCQYDIGRHYYFGKGVPQDFKEALRWFKRAAKQGDADAEHAVGEIYEKGLGVTKNLKTAVKWYRLASKQGKDHAKNILKLLKRALFPKQ